jgi:hypothetical protein
MGNTGLKGVFVIKYRKLACVGFPWYRVGDDGSVWRWWSRKGWKKIKGKYTKKVDGYRKVRLCGFGKKEEWLVHRLVLLAFVGPCPVGFEARHFPDRDKQNCNLRNLSWTSKSINQRDRIIHQTSLNGRSFNNGTSHGRSIYTWEEVLSIRSDYSLGVGGYKALAKKYGGDWSGIRNIVKGKSYRKENDS